MDTAMTKSGDLNLILDNLERIPPVLYKYRTFDECRYGVSLAVGGASFFASAQSLNDPFDTHFHPTSILTELA